MADIKISRDKLLELLGEAYQDGCFGYMELKETQCAKIAEQVKDEEIVPTISTDNYTYTSSQAIMDSASWERINREEAAQEGARRYQQYIDFQNLMTAANYPHLYGCYATTELNNGEETKESSKDSGC